jgi:hypothetical protein
MQLVLSGFAGVGKSSIVELTQKEYKNVFICPESAREVNYTKNFYQLQNDTNHEFFQKSVMDNEIMKIMITHMNKIEHVIYDRCILDNFAFAEIFYGSDRVNYKEFKNFVKETCERFEIETLYDSIFFIHSTENEDFVLKNILNDPFRKATTSHDVKEFMKKAKEWEKIYFDLYDQIDGISKVIKKVHHFSENSNYDNEVNNLLDVAFKTR